MENSVKIELGCGEAKKPEFNEKGFIRMDIVRTKRTDLVCDLTKGLPFKDNCVDEVYSCHFMEHLTPTTLRDLLNDIVRVCKNGGKVATVIPFWSHQTAMFPSHNYTLPPEFWRHLEIYQDHWFYRKHGYMVIIGIEYFYTDWGLKVCEKLDITPEEGREFLNNVVYEFMVTTKVIKKEA